MEVLEPKKEGVSREEFDAFVKEIKEAVCTRLEEIKAGVEAMRSEAKKPEDVDMRFYHCDEEGCSFVADDIGALVEHISREEVKKLSSELPKPMHVTAEEFLACPKCFPEFEKAFLEKGWRKPEPKRESGEFGI